MEKFTTLEQVFADPFFAELMQNEKTETFFASLYELNNGDHVILLNSENLFHQFAKVAPYRATASGYPVRKFEAVNNREAGEIACSLFNCSEETPIRFYECEWSGAK